jgi:hypothetical protein
VGYVVDKVALGHISFQYFGFPCQFSINQNAPYSKIGQLAADKLCGLSLSHLTKLNNNKKATFIEEKKNWQETGKAPTGRSHFYKTGYNGH